MAVNCNNCGKSYFVDPKKINYEGNRRAYFNCRYCHHKVIFDKFQLNSAYQKKQETAPSSIVVNLQNKRNENRAKQPPQVEIEEKRPHFGSRIKMIILFVVIPIIFMTFSNTFLLLQMTTLSKSITEESTKALTESGEKIIFEKARAVAQAVDLYLSTHPMLQKERFLQNKEFKKIALQKVGLTGYTVLVSKPDQNNPSRLWVHPRKELVGVNVVKTMKDILSDKYQDWYKIQEGAFKHDVETSGYYTWLDKRLKFMAMVPVKNTDLFAVSTTYIDEFTRPLNNLREASHKVTNKLLVISLLIIFITILTIGPISFFFGSKIRTKQPLTEVGGVKSSAESTDKGRKVRC